MPKKRPLPLRWKDSSTRIIRVHRATAFDTRGDIYADMARVSYGYGPRPLAFLRKFCIVKTHFAHAVLDLGCRQTRTSHFSYSPKKIYLMHGVAIINISLLTTAIKNS